VHQLILIEVLVLVRIELLENLTANTARGPARVRASRCTVAVTV